MKTQVKCYIRDNDENHETASHLEDTIQMIRDSLEDIFVRYVC